MQGEILDFLKKHDVKYKENINLSVISPVRIGGEAKIVAYPDEESKLCELVSFFRKLKIKHKVAGRMSNLLPPDENYDGILIRTDLLNNCSVSGNLLVASSGAGLPYCASLLCQHGLSGFEGLSGIPGSIGGAVIGNAGAFGQEICDRLVSVRVFDLKEEIIKILPQKDCGFGYRTSALKASDLIILSAGFELFSSDSLTVRAEMERCRKARLDTQPKEPSLGSTFKRPGDSIFAARLIDECGLKGYSLGGAEVSRKHAGFIVNRGSATSKDYIELSEYVAKCVYEKYKISLQREVEIMR